MHSSLQKIKNVIQLYLKESGGQAMTEYVALVALFIGITLMLIVLLDSFSRYGWRILGLVGMDYP